MSFNIPVSQQADLSQVNVEIVKGISNKSGQEKPWRAIKIVIGDWENLIFPRTKFEFDYICSILKISE